MRALRSARRYFLGRLKEACHQSAGPLQQNFAGNTIALNRVEKWPVLSGYVIRGLLFSNDRQGAALFNLSWGHSKYANGFRR